MISPERLDTLQTYWVRLAANFRVEPIDAYPIFDRLIAAYTHSQRHYHNLEHIAEMLKIAPRLASGDIGLLILAVWFHDVVYDPRATDNEAQSAATADEWLTPFTLTAEQRAELRRLILLTDHRNSDVVDSVGQALLDADLAILAAGESRYARYAAAIRQEYAHVTDEDYRRGRTLVLRQFLDRERIYHTTTMRLEAEGAARRNLQAELQSLVLAGANSGE